MDQIKFYYEFVRDSSPEEFFDSFKDAI